MEDYLFLGLVCLCLILTTIFLFVRVKYGSIAGLLTKVLASFSFVLLAVVLSFTKMQSNYYASLSIAFLILGLVCGLIGDILLDLKVMYVFHEDKYLKAGMLSFGVGHVFYIASMLTLLNNEVYVFEKWLPLVLIFAGAMIASIVVWLVSKNVLKLNFGKNTLITNCYSFVLIFTTALSIYLNFVGLSVKMFILSIGFGLFLVSDLILSTQYFGGKQDNKKLIVFNHLTYYLAQIIIASFIYFI